MPSSSYSDLEPEEDPIFDCPKDEAAFYREKCRKLTGLLEDTQNELDEFQASSKELETELEQELLATEAKQTEYKERIKRLESEREEWIAKHVNLQKMHSTSTSAMQREMDNLKSERDKTLVALRDLEMGNDELERNERVAVSSLLDLESKYNRSIEEKTLLEQELIAKQELDEECQRLKDELRDANEEIAILRDQVARVLPTPPSSVSIQPSPKRDSIEVGLVAETFSEAVIPSPESRSMLDVEPTPVPSPLLRRTTIGSPVASRIPRSPSVARAGRISTHGDTLSAGSPRLARGESIWSSNAAASTNNLAAKREANKLLHKMQMRLESTSAKLVGVLPKRNVSQPGPVGAGRRTTSIGVPGQSQAPQPVPGMAATPAADRSLAGMMSPSGWVMVSDGEDTPTNAGASRPHHPLSLVPDHPSPDSPMPAGLRAVSAASSSRALPSRPAIPSPLTTNLSKSTSRIPAPKSSPLHRSTRTPLRLDDRLMSPSMLPQPARSMTLTPTLSQSTSRTLNLSTSTNRPSSRQSLSNAARPGAGAKTLHSALGRGPPPTTLPFPAQQAIRTSLSGAGAHPPLAKRTPRRSSLGVVDGASTGIPMPTPRASPGRPISMPVAHTTPPPVPRIPSAHVRESVKRQAALESSRAQR